MTGTFKDQRLRHRAVYTPPWDLAGPAKIISNNADGYDQWDVYITIGSPGNCIFGPCKVELNIRNRLRRIQSAETIYNLHTGNGYTKEGESCRAAL